MRIDDKIKQAATAIQHADALLITAGAGMGVDSGLPDFRGTRGFWQAYPAIAKLGLAFEEMANPSWFSENPELAWAFYGHRLNLYRQTVPHEGFSQLLAVGRSKPRGYFVFTSNVDGQFQRAGFAAECMVECHGSIHHLQCSKSCTDDIWDGAAEKVVVDEEVFRAKEPLPRCPACGALARVLPRESDSRPYDMSQLSLIWPYNIVDFATKKIILHNIETHLVGERGVCRYPGDVYCGKGLVPGDNETAEWPLGLAWLAICYAKLAEHGRDFDAGHKAVHFDWTQRRAYFYKAVHYFQQLEKNMTADGCVPEMYLGDQTGHNTPLAWAQSFHIISGQILTNLAAAHPREFKIPHEVRHRREHLAPVLAVG